MLVSRTSLLLALASLSVPLGQSPQNAGGTHLSFEVASIRPASPGARDATNLDLDPSDFFRYVGGPVTASGSLINYIIFAYKIEDRSQADLIYSHLPAWTRQPYTLRATAAESKPTKDQFRLMVQSLLAERFQFKLHTEIRQLPIYALVVDHTPAPGLTPVPPDDTLCSKPFDQPKPPPHSSALPRSCQLIVFHNGDLRQVRMGDFSLTQVAGSLVLASMGALDARPVLDETGLKGRYDLDFEFLPPKKPSDTSPEEPGATFEEALKRQAGLKLVKQIGSVSVYVIDRLEPPTEN